MGYKDPNQKRIYNRTYRRLNGARLKEMDRAWYIAHRAYAIEASKNRYQKLKADPVLLVKRRRQHRIRALTIKQEVLAHYANASVARCVSCGFTDLRGLALDHINDDGYLSEKRGQPRGGVVLLSWLKAEGYPTGYQTLCFNCNEIKKEVLIRAEAEQRDEAILAKSPYVSKRLATLALREHSEVPRLAEQW